MRLSQWISKRICDSVIGKFRAISLNHDRVGDWNSLLDMGDPFPSRDVNRYLSCINEEQLQVRVTPSQAIPLLLSDLAILVDHILAHLSTLFIKTHQVFLCKISSSFLGHFSFLAITSLICPMFLNEFLPLIQSPLVEKFASG